MSTPPLHHPVPQHRVTFDGVQGGYYQQDYPAQTGYSGQYHPDSSNQGQNAYQGGYAHQYQGSYAPPPQNTYQNGPTAEKPTNKPQGSQFAPFNPMNIVQNADIGKQAFDYGQQYISQSMDSYGLSFGYLRYYFHVSNAYVRQKLGLVLFPWFPRRQWARQLQPVQDAQGVDLYAFPSEDVNAPDMYIPLMAFVTHLLVKALDQGIVDKFSPDQFGAHASKALGLMVLELVFLKIFTYLLSCSRSSLLDLCAYSGYKYVGITVTSLVSLVDRKPLHKWLVFAYTGLSTAFFMLRSLKYILLSSARTDSTAATVSGRKRQQRIYFLFFYGTVCQLALMWLLL